MKMLCIATLILIHNTYTVSAQDTEYYYLREYKSGLGSKQNDSILNYWISISGTDTVKSYINNGKYSITNKEGVVIVDGHALAGMGTECGCTPRPHGAWLERYPSGKIKSLGEFYCGRKKGKWVTFFDNGSISKIESYESAYPNILCNNYFIWDTLPKGLYLRSGIYQEYYTNGNLKVDGEYSIVVEHQDSTWTNTFDVNTYEQKRYITKGDYWFPKSIKIGKWIIYNENGKVVKLEDYNFDYDNKKIKPINERCLELLLSHE